MAYQYGGWYNNPATGKNQRWFNGVWTDGAEPGGGSSSSSAVDSAKKNYEMASGEVNTYIDQLIKQAKGDYDFAAKWIENNYKLALGTDDTAKAQFLKQVANSLEEKVGRIAFDYQTGTYRVNQDADSMISRTQRDQSTALQRLNEDDAAYRQTYDRQLQQGREAQNASLNERGILTTPRDQATGLAGKEVRNFEADQTDQLSAYERTLARNRQDINTSGVDYLADTNLQRNRSLEDLTTESRRAGIDAASGRQYSVDSAQRILDQKKLAAEQQRRSLLNGAAVKYADYVTRGGSGLY